MKMNASEFSFKTRQDEFKSCDAPEKVFDVVVVGGGIVGAGVLRELALRGKRGILFEKNDFASSTSSKSSKLIHGGLRYLEMLDFHLVFEALAERHWLLKTHPHLVTPLPFVLPVFEHKQAPQGARPKFILNLGLWLYDLLSLFRSPFFHGWYSAQKLLKKFPGLKNKGLKGGLYYADAIMNDDEMVLECLLSAKKYGAQSLNYVKVSKIECKKNLFAVSVQDEKSGLGEKKVLAKKVIVCTGPWVQNMDSMVDGGIGKKIKPSKGIHLVVPWKRFPIEGCLVMYAPEGRIVFVISRKDMGEGAEKVIIGTTDSSDQGDLEALCAESHEVQYLLKIIDEHFPEVKLTAEDIVTTYAGVRPLVDDGNESEAKTSREHEIWDNKTGVTFVAGGKYTTFRPMSEEIVDFVYPDTRDFLNARKSREPLSSPKEYEARFVAPNSKGTKIWGRYTEEFLLWKLRYHCPLTLEDVVFRRIPLWLEGCELDRALLEHVGEICQKYFGWSDEELKSQINTVDERLELGSLWKNHGH